MCEGVSGFETEPTAIGIGWPSHQNSHKWEYLSQFGEGTTITGKLISDPKIDSEALRFAVRYSLAEKLAAVHEVVEEYEVKKDSVHVSVRRLWLSLSLSPLALFLCSLSVSDSLK